MSSVVRVETLLVSLFRRFDVSASFFAVGEVVPKFTVALHHELSTAAAVANSFFELYRLPADSHGL